MLCQEGVHFHPADILGKSKCHRGSQLNSKDDEVWETHDGNPHMTICLIDIHGN